MNAAIAQVLAAVVLFGGAWPITKAALANATPMWFAAGRAGLATFATIVLLAFLRQLSLPKRQDWPTVLSIGVLQLGGFFAFVHAAVALVPAGRTAILSNVVTYWVIPLSVLILGEQVTPRRWLSAGIGISGAVVMAGPWAIDWSGAALVGHLMLLAGGLSWSLAIIASRRWPPVTPMLRLLPWCFGVATCVLGPLALALEPSGGIRGPSWPFMLYIGFIAAPIGTWCVIEIGRHLPGAISSVVLLAVPAFGVLVSTLWLHEVLGWDIMLGGGLIMASVVVAATDRGMAR